MSDPNNPGLIPDPQQLFNLPQPNYNLLNSGNPALDLLFMQAVPQLLGIKADEFLPQLMPAQHVFDQMASYKYRMSTARNEEFARSKFGGASRSDDQAMFRTILNVRNQLSKDPVSSTQAVQLQGAAEMMNSQFGQNLIEMMVGPQMAEDIFFGSRGSKVRLARAVNQIGFSRRDTVTGKQSMSAESLEALTDNVFNNLYGDNADIDDVAGFSAGRVGDLMTGLARRGLLPQSAVNMNPEERRRVFKDKSLRTPGDKDFAAVEGQLDAGASVEELAKTAEGAAAVRKIDAKRVANTLKEYTGALSAVREIFGDNGMPNAPMGQLMAAMDALTQNTLSSQTPAKIEQTLRRMQMASRDSGISMEALMGLTGRSGALADKYGLSREIASENVIGAVERSKALNDTGGFSKPGFNRVDPTKAAMFMLDQGMRADSSGVGRMIAVANRIVEENKTNKDFEKTGSARNLVKMVDALKRGATTYYDDERKEQVDIYKEMGTNPGDFFQSYFTRAGISDARVGAYYRDPNTQEFMIGGRAVYAQAAELKQQMTGNFMANTGIADIVAKASKLPEAQHAALNQRISQNLSAALVDEVNTTMSAEQRLDVMQRAMKAAVVSHVRDTEPKLSDKDVEARANALLTGPGGMFKDEKEMRDALATQQGRAGIYVQARTGMSMGGMQQIFNKYTQAEAASVQQANIARAELFGGISVGGNTNFLQRLSDSGGNPIAALGTIKNPQMRKVLMRAIAGSNDKTDLEKAEATVESAFSSLAGVVSKETASTDTVIDDLAANKTTLDDLVNAGRVVSPAAAENLRGKTFRSTKDTAEMLKKAHAKDENKPAFDAYLMHLYGQDKDAVAAAIKSGEAYTLMASKAATRNVLAGDGVKLDYTDKDMTEAEFRNMHPVLFAEGLDPTGKFNVSQKRMAAADRLGAEMKRGQVTAGSILDVYGEQITDPKKREEAEKSLKAALAPAATADDQAAADKILEAAGVDADRRKAALDTAALGRGYAKAGGLDYLGSDVAPLEIALREKADKGLFKKDSKIYEILMGADYEAKRKLLTTPGEVDKHLSEIGTYEGKTTDVDAEKHKEDIYKRAAELSGAQKSVTDPTGMVGALGGAVGTAIENAMKTALTDVKIENVTISKIDFPSIDLSKIVSGAVGAVFGSAPKASVNDTAATGKQEFTGTLRVIDLGTAVIEAMPKDMTTHIAGGIPVHNVS